MGSSLALLFGYLVMLLWNNVLPEITGHLLTYWQAVGMLILARLLVGGFCGHGRRFAHGLRHHRETWQDYDEWWREVGRKSLEEFTTAPKEKK